MEKRKPTEWPLVPPIGGDISLAPEPTGAYCIGGGNGGMGYLMLKTLSVQNFRCFERFELNDLKRLNIVVGRNAAGKTALLESIRLACGGTPTIAWNLSSQRGHPVAIQPNPTPDIFEAPWRPLFFNFNFKNEVKIAFTNTDGRTATLRMFSDPKRSITPTSPPLQPGAVMATWGVPSPITPIAFERTDLAGKETTLLATVHLPYPQQQPFYQLYLEPGPELETSVELFQSTFQVNSQQVAQWFSTLAIANKEGPIKTAIREEFNFISDLTVQSPMNIAVVYATMDYLQEKIPLSFVSSGINKLFTFMNSIITFGSGIVLIDELENGVHSSILPHMWEILHRLACDNDTQLFMTTHSWECLKAALPAIEKAEVDFSLIKIERDGLCATPKSFGGADLAAALEEEFDIRQ
jgi:predicted ATPase